MTTPPSPSDLARMAFEPSWPFRTAATGVEQYNQRTSQWQAPKGQFDSAGYILLNWMTGSKRHFMREHRVCWITHNGPVPSGLELDHIDGDKTNNQITNLRLVTHAENIRYARALRGNWSAVLKKLKPHQEALLLALPVGWRCLHELASRWNMSKYALGNIRAQAKKSGDPRYLGGL